MPTKNALEKKISDKDAEIADLKTKLDSADLTVDQKLDAHYEKIYKLVEGKHKSEDDDESDKNDNDPEMITIPKDKYDSMVNIIRDGLKSRVDEKALDKMDADKLILIHDLKDTTMIGNKLPEGNTTDKKDSKKFTGRSHLKPTFSSEVD